jgi:hypothetical protein
MAIAKALQITKAQVGEITEFTTSTGAVVEGLFTCIIEGVRCNTKTDDVNKIVKYWNEANVRPSKTGGSLNMNPDEDFAGSTPTDKGASYLEALTITAPTGVRTTREIIGAKRASAMEIEQDV